MPSVGFVASALVGFFGSMAVVSTTIWWPWTLCVGAISATVAALTYRWARRRYK